MANKWMSSAAKSAPMCAEAVLHEELRTACSPGWQGQVGLEAQLLASFSTSTSRGQLTGLQALSRKLYYSGVVSGLEVRLPLPRARHLLKLSEHCFASEGFQPCSCFGRVVNLLQQRFLAARGKRFGPSRNCLADFVRSLVQASRSVGDNMTSWSLAADMLRTAVQEGTADVTRLQVLPNFVDLPSFGAEIQFSLRGTGAPGLFLSTAAAGNQRVAFPHRRSATCRRLRYWLSMAAR